MQDNDGNELALKPPGVSRNTYYESDGHPRAEDSVVHAEDEEKLCVTRENSGEIWKRARLSVTYTSIPRTDALSYPRTMVIEHQYAL